MFKRFASSLLHVAPFLNRLVPRLVERRLLAIAWYLPPMVVPRSIQISRTLKALRARGWTSDVVTADPASVDGLVRDEAFASVYRGEYTLHPVDVRAPDELSDSRLRWNAPLNSTTESNWLRGATHQAERVIRKRRPHALVTFSQPLIDHAVGLELARRHPKLPWIAHFSDPGVDNPYAAGSPPERLDQWRTEEEAVVERADALVFVNRYTAKLVMSKYPADRGSKVFVVSHGYDADLLSNIPPLPSRRPRLHLVHAGHFYGLRRADALLRALARLDAGGETESEIDVTFAGSVAEQDRQLAADLGVAHRINVLGPLPLLETLRIIASADVLLVIDAPADINVFLPSKIFDYFLFRKPILGITPEEGATADVLRRCGHDVVSPTDEGAIARALQDMVQRGLAGALDQGIVLEEVERFDIRKSSAEFERAILAAIERRNRQ